MRRGWSGCLVLGVVLGLWGNVAAQQAPAPGPSVEQRLQTAQGQRDDFVSALMQMCDLRETNLRQRYEAQLVGMQRQLADLERQLAEAKKDGATVSQATPPSAQ